VRLDRLAVAVLWFAAVGFAAAGVNAAPAVSGTVTVFAAASLTAAVQSVVSAFEHAHPGVTVRLNFAGSQTLVQQIQQGAPADVFAAADEVNMQKLVREGAVRTPPEVFAGNTLQIVVAAGNPKHIKRLSDLARTDLILALCGPAVPCGRYAIEAFGKAEVPVPAASQELDVKAVVTKVALGEVDAGIVYATDVRAAGRAVEGVAIPASVNIVGRYPIAALRSAPNPEAAAAFVTFVLSSQAQHLLAGYGFLPR
jgi:molybdate transport system substrate-binding protein